jgi:hypothetical protein
MSRIPDTQGEPRGYASWSLRATEGERPEKCVERDEKRFEQMKFIIAKIIYKAGGGAKADSLLQ